MTKTFEQRYQAARESTLILQQPQPAILNLDGPDALDLLNRMSTNAMLSSGAGDVRNTVFTNANARVVDIASVIPGHEAYLLLSWRDSASVLREWLSHYIFFQDDVRVNAASHEWMLFDFLGPKAGDNLRNIAPFKDYAGEGLLRLPEGFLWSEPLGNLPRFRLLCHAGLAQQLLDPGRGVKLPILDSNLHELLCIEAGVPRMNFEIEQTTIPLEVGLWDYVSFSKGCYIGQEIIARMESRGKLARTLVGVHLDHEAKPGTDLIQDGRTIGVITSCAHSPRFSWIGLASIKPATLENQEAITLADTGTSVHLQPLPFT